MTKKWMGFNASLMLLKLVVGLNILFVLTTGFLIWAAGDAKAFSWAVRQAAARFYKSGEIRQFEVRALTYRLPWSWELRDVSARVMFSGKELNFTAAELNVFSAGHLIWPQRRVTVSAHSAVISYDKGQAHEAAGEAVLSRDGKRIFCRGRISAASASWDKINAGPIDFLFDSAGAELRLYDIHGDAYGGQVKGVVDYSPAGGYVADLTLDRLQVVRLEKDLGGPFRDLGGSLSGKVYVKGSGAWLQKIETAVDMPAGGQISAAMLSSIASYLPSSQEKKRLAELIQSRGKLAVEVFSFTIRNDRPDVLSGRIGLKSREANLELNVAHEIHIDARIGDLIKAWQAVFK